MKKLFESISSIGVHPNDKEDAVLQKRFLIYQALLMSAGGLLWGFLAIAFNRIWQSTIPFGYGVITALNLTFFHYTRHFSTAKIIQTAISLLLPFLFQWVLGGFIASGGVMLWALIALATSINYQSNRTVLVWFVMYVVLTLVSGIFDNYFIEWISPVNTIEYSIVIMVLNIIIISGIMLWLMNFMVRGKNDALKKLQLAQSQIVQSEKMATLGTLAAGVAHELNNPAAASRRASQQLREVLTLLEKAREDLLPIELNPQEQEKMITLAKQAREVSIKPKNLTSIERSDAEVETEEWLEDHNVAQPWEIAPSLVSMNLGKNQLETLYPSFHPAAFNAVIIWVARLFPVYSLLYEIGESSARISEIVVALKNYSFLGQAPVQQINIHEGIENTLVILRNKIKSGITIHRNYGEDVPEITAYGSELNQVWTNILDNAIDAMKEKGEITITTRKENNCISVEIEDNGPGIPPAILPRIYDPFFTTKEPGKGTGLGLSTSFGIVTEKHKGKIMVQSAPGCTRFVVKLPIQYQVQTVN